MYVVFLYYKTNCKYIICYAVNDYILFINSFKEDNFILFMIQYIINVIKWDIYL